MSMKEGLMSYELVCYVIDKDKGKVLATFNAREIMPAEKQFSPVLGGIASLGQNYSIATKDAKIELIPNNYKLRIGGNTFLITGTAVYSRRPPFGRTLNLPSNDELIVYLQ